MSAAANSRVKTAIAVSEASVQSSRLSNIEVGDALLLADAAVGAAPATQIRKPWRTTARSAFQFIVALATLLPVLVDSLGLDRALPVVAGALALAAVVTRVMALPQVESFLQSFVPWLAASPRSP